MLGNLTINLNRIPITGSLSNKAAALLCYLVANKDKAFSRDKLASIFWDSSAAETSRYNLRYTLWSLRKILDADKGQFPIILTHKDSCRINPDISIFTDVSEMERLLNDNPESDGAGLEEKLDMIKSIYKGEFLEGFYINKCPEFNDWVFFERERLQRKYYEVLSRLTRLYKANGSYYKSIEVLNEMLRINPLQEELYEDLIKDYIELGDRSSALNQYKRCSNILRDELNISPNEGIRKLYQVIKSSGSSINEHSYRASAGKPVSGLRAIFLEEKSCAEALPDNSPTDTEVTISVICHPAVRITFGTLSDIIRMIIENLSQDLLKKLPQHYWKDLYRIESSACEVYSSAISTDSLTLPSEKIKVFTALERLLNIVSSEMQFGVNIKAYQWMDDISMEFLKYYISRNRTAIITFRLEGPANETLFSELSEFITAERSL